MRYDRAMTEDRRRFTRQPGPFEATWSGSSGNRDCRITDLSPGGCFIDSVTSAEPGDTIEVTVVLGETRITVPGEVVYRDRIQGFGVRFPPSDQSRALAYAMGAEPPGE